MVADKGKKSKVAETAEVEDSDHIDGDLVLSIEKLQEVQDELEKVIFPAPPPISFVCVSLSTCILSSLPSFSVSMVLRVLACSFGLFV